MYFLQRMELAHQLGDRLSEARAICNIGNALRLTGSLKEAQKCYLENLECSREIGDLPGESIALLNLGTITESLGDLDKAASWYTMVRAWGLDHSRIIHCTQLHTGGRSSKLY